MINFWVLIPARAGSTRLPNKPLADIDGKPMIAHVIEAAKKSGANKIIVATDDQNVKNVSKSFGASSIMTNIKHESGSDRIAEVAEILKAPDDQIIVNLQGDEPLMPPSVIKKVAQLKEKNKKIQVTTVATKINNFGEIGNPNCVKVILNKFNEAIYFSRSIIPYQRDQINKSSNLVPNLSIRNSQFTYLRHVGIYCFQIGDLKKFVSWGPCQLELVEKLEQLRWLWNRKTIKVMIETEKLTHGVDTEQDLKKIRSLFQNKKTT